MKNLFLQATPSPSYFDNSDGYDLLSMLRWYFENYFFDILTLIIFLSVIGFIVRFVGNSKNDEIQPNQINKIVNVDFTGGIIGLFFSSPRTKLNKIIASENQQGWKVVSIIDSEKGNFFTMLFQTILLFVTLFFYTKVNGKYIVFEKNNSIIQQ
jgi:hypothetical protein